MTFYIDDRVVQIPLSGPVRYGTVMEVTENESVGILWDSTIDDALSWYTTEDLGSIYRVLPNGRKLESHRPVFGMPPEPRKD